MALRVLYERCCGLDVHKGTVVACVLTPGRKEVRTFGTFTRDLLRLADWLRAEQVTHVALEATGVFWKPVVNLLEDTGLALLVVNARHVKAVPGRKTDVKDAQWLARVRFMEPGRHKRDGKETRDLLRPTAGREQLQHLPFSRGQPCRWPRVRFPRVCPHQR